MTKTTEDLNTAYCRGCIDRLCTRNICVPTALLAVNGQRPTADNIRLICVLRDDELVNLKPSLDDH